jgi:hypothetical protein
MTEANGTKNSLKNFLIAVGAILAIGFVLWLASPNW